MKSPVEIVRMYLEGWETKDRSKLRLSEHFRHTSAEAVYNNASDFLSECWQFSGTELHNIEFASEGNIVCVRYEIKISDGEIMKFCEWITVEDEKITSVDVYTIHNRKQ